MSSAKSCPFCSGFNELYIFCIVMATCQPNLPIPCNQYLSHCRLVYITVQVHNDSMKWQFNSEVEEQGISDAWSRLVHHHPFKTSTGGKLRWVNIWYEENLWQEHSNCYVPAISSLHAKYQLILAFVVYQILSLPTEAWYLHNFLLTDLGKGHKINWRVKMI